MKRRHFLQASAAAAIAAVTDRHAWAAPVSRIVDGFPPGGMVDVTARVIAEALGAELGTTFIVENKPGAGGRIGVGVVQYAAPDGQTLLMTPSAMIVTYPNIYKGLGYDAFTLAPVTTVTNIYKVLAVSYDNPAKTLDEFIALAKQKPNGAKIGVPGAGSGPHFVALELAKQSGAKFVVVPYLGDPPVWQNVMAGVLDAGVATLVTSAPLHRAKKLRVLAITAPERSPRVPGAPTFKELGLDIKANEWLGLLAPPKTPAATIAKLNQAVRKVLGTAKLRTTFENIGLEPTGCSVEEFASIIKTDFEDYRQIVKVYNFKISN